MRTRDREVFLKAAARFQAWILVRQSNPRSFQYVGKAIYQPKPISCKPKTSDVPVGQRGKQVDGLVVDPVRWPEAFSGHRRGDAIALWMKFRSLHNLGEFKRTTDGRFVFEGARGSGAAYGIDAEPGSRHEGCLTFEGKYIYGDYDLFDMVFVHAAKPGPVSQVPVGPKHAPKFQTVDYRAERWNEVSQFLNQQLGFSMIQHGSQFDWKKDGFESAEAFGPNGEAPTWNASEVEQKYREWKRTNPD